jgi:hypothetical protein
LQNPPKFTQSGNFGMKKYYMATLGAKSKLRRRERRRFLNRWNSAWSQSYDRELQRQRNLVKMVKIYSATRSLVGFENKNRFSST